MISPVILVTIVVTGVVFVLNYILRQLKKFKDINKLPGPSALDLIWLTFRGGSAYDKFKYVSSLNKKYGPVVKMWIKPFDPVIMVADAEHFDKILLSKTHLTKTKMYDLLKPYIGEGLATTSMVDVWKKDRRICNVAFQPSTVTGFLPIFSKHTDRYLTALKKQTGKVVDTQPLMHLYTLDIVFESIAKQDQNFLENSASVYLDARLAYFKILAERLYSIFLQADTIFRFSEHFRVMEKALGSIRGYTKNIIESEEKKRENGDYKNSKLNLIDILFENTIQGDALNDQINTFILAAHDTIAQAMCYTLFELSKHSEFQQKAYKEVVSIVGKDKTAEITYSDLQEMKYIDCIVKESLRMHTVVPIIERFVGEDLNIDGIHYPKGTQFSLHLDGVHKSEKYYKNPYKFDPDRFLPENSHLLTRNTYAPFSLGPRDCIGKLYAMLVVKFFIAKFLQKFEAKPVENHELKIINEIIIKSASGIPVILKERE